MIRTAGFAALALPRRRRTAPIFDYPGLRDRDDVLDGEVDASRLLAELLTPYRRGDVVVRAASLDAFALAKQTADAMRARFDSTQAIAAGIVIVVEEALLDAVAMRSAVMTARECGAVEIVAAAAFGARIALREIAREVDAVYCVSMQTGRA